jgi:hypothetical protein
MRSLSGIATALAVFTCTAVVAAGMTRDEYKAARARIAAEYEADRQQCGAHLGHAAELCVTRARGAKQVAQAELEATYKPSPRTNYDAAIARAKSTYAIAKKECEDQKGDAREGCEKDARAAQERARAAATAARKASVASEAALPKQ